ncbi:unnamed protein product [Sordaria macrospora k-hell]|uniref:WGS project CABT00000000 data, contig 2.5 n=1 Tax=Sordaria macrospora (strain ATCC MYA-333 / DSM 997 / K(L3346) / K-hell) TaxID=771870 RepID=F7VS85_SORMK|nr:uncharacterized protein SMAC_01917 [Sordaria macrospora k-hell]CCC08371.1 unnamed protein product [Sordaria macrospora k-hell]
MDCNLSDTTQQQQQHSPATPQQHHHLQIQQQQQQSLQSNSVDNLPDTASIHNSPFSGQGQGQAFVANQQPPPPPPKTKQSTRKLIKNILSGSSSHRNHDSHSGQSSWGDPSGVVRRSSRRISQPPPPPAIRTGVSQVSLDHPPADWQTQYPPSQPSPLQTAEYRDSYLVAGQERDLHLQNPQDGQYNPTIRPVPPEKDVSPYSAGESGYHQQQQSHPQLQVQIPPEPQQQQFNQAEFEAALQQQHQHSQQVTPQDPYQTSSQVQYQASTHSAVSGHLGNPQHKNPETVSQLSRESPTIDSDQRSATNVQSSLQASDESSYTPQSQDIPLRQNPLPAQPSAQPQGKTPQQQVMAPQPGGRRSQDTTDKATGIREIQPPPGPPPSYRQSQQPSMNNLSQPSNAGGQSSSSYRQGDRQGFDGSGDQGRNSPQPASSERAAEDQEKTLKELLTKYKNVKRLYFDGKKEIEQLGNQVEQLQNAIANQRMSQSRTSLDDSEYTTRFNRLQGAITNLAFNIRKEWKTLPKWLDPYVTADALKTGRQEMTAVGRAVITRWVVDEIFNRCFHPGLEPELSKQLKTIEQNIRHFSYTLNSQEEHDALTSKVLATSNLTAHLFQHLTEPAPVGVDGSVGMIVELAVGIASNLPLESRDVAIVYPLPEQPIQTKLMEVEKTALPPLEGRPSDASEEGTAGDGAKESSKERARGDKATRSGMLNTIHHTIGGNSAAGGPPGSRKGSIADSSTLPTAPSGAASQSKDAGRVRFAGSFGVEVRGRHVLVKAPVWTI